MNAWLLVPLVVSGVAVAGFWVAAIAALSALERLIAERERAGEPLGLAAFILRDAPAAVTAWGFGAAVTAAFAAAVLGSGLAAAGMRAAFASPLAAFACALAALVSVLAWKRVAEAFPRAVCDIAAVTVLPFYLLLYPVRRGLAAALERLYPPLTAGAGLLRKEAVEELAEGDDGDRLLDRDEREMIARVIHLGETVVREIMVPRIDMVAIEENSAIADVIHVIEREGHSRLPVYRDSIDEIVGFLYAKDLITHHDRLGELHLRDLVRPTYFVPETKRVAELLAEMRSRRVYLAMVVDEYGGTAGLVTLEDVIEEVVGEIHDELDEEQALVHPLGDGSYRVDAKVDLDDLNDKLQVALPADEYDTLGGLLYGLAGKIPATGDRFEHSGLEFTIAGVRGKRITQVHVRPSRATVPGGHGE
jgi:CBS domain containing-hemolysin-like protein